MTPRADEVLVDDVLDEGGADAAAILNTDKDVTLRGWVIPAIIGSALVMEGNRSGVCRRHIGRDARSRQSGPLRPKC